jgi:hypothetical protein
MTPKAVLNFKIEVTNLASEKSVLRIAAGRRIAMYHS